MIRVAIAGCCGRMGRRLSQLVVESKDLELAAVFERKGFPNLAEEVSSFISQKKPFLITDNAEEAIAAADVVIDFTFPKVSLELVKYAKKHKTKMVMGTTGFSAKELQTIKRASQTTAIVHSPNMSVGVNLLFKLSTMVAETLNDTYDIEIVEHHHKHKKDAPSGTAVKLADCVAEGRKVSMAKKGVYGRKGFTGERKKGSIGVHAVRGGDVVGDHVVAFLGDGERVELGHKASSRDCFVRGSLVAVRFIQRKRKGLFSMNDVLGL